MPHWTEEVFKIHLRKGKNRRLDEIKDYNNEEQLQDINNPTEFRIKSILKKKRKEKQTLHLVKWSDMIQVSTHG